MYCAFIPCCVWRWFHLCVQPDAPRAVVCLLWGFVCPTPYTEHHHCPRTAAGMNCLQTLRHSHHPRERRSERWWDKQPNSHESCYRGQCLDNVLSKSVLHINDHIQFRTLNLWCTETEGCKDYARLKVTGQFEKLTVEFTDIDPINGKNHAPLIQHFLRTFFRKTFNVFRWKLTKHVWVTDNEVFVTFSLPLASRSLSMD